MIIMIKIIVCAIILLNMLAIYKTVYKEHMDSNLKAIHIAGYCVAILILVSTLQDTLFY
jgi:hypothetical protein